MPSPYFLHQLFVVAREGLIDTWLFQNHIRQIADAKNGAAFLTTWTTLIPTQPSYDVTATAGPTWPDR